MNCTEFEHILEESVEARRPADAPSLREHAAGCAACRTRWEHYTVLERAIPLWRDRVPDVNLADSILAQITVDAGTENNHANDLPDPAMRPAAVGEAFRVGGPGTRLEPAVAPGRSGWHLATLLTIVAAALLLLVRSVSLPPGVGRDAPARIARRDGDTTFRKDKQQQPRNEADAEIDTLLHDAGSAYFVLARGAADAFAEVRVFAPVGERDDRKPGNEMIPQWGASAWVERWREGFQPIGRDLEDAVDFLFDAVPLEAAPAT